MPDQIIEIPNVGRIAFPASMTPDQINAAAGKLYAEKNPNHPPPDPKHSWVDTAVDWLPTAGGIVGGIAGGMVGGPLGAVAGSALGGAAGEGYKQTANFARQQSGVPTSELQMAGKMGQSAAIQGAGELVGQGVAAGMGTVAQATGRSLMTSALKPGLKDSLGALKAGKASPLVKTLLDEGVNVSENGIGKLNTLISSTNAEIKDALDQVSPNIRVNPFKVAAKLGETAKTFANQVNPASDLEAVSRAGQEFLAAHPDMSVQEAQAIKQGTYKQLSGKYGELSSADTESQKALARGLKDEIANEVNQSIVGLKGILKMPGGVDISAANAREGALLQAREAVARRVAVAGRRDPMGLASLAVSHPITFVSVLMDRSPAVKSMLARGLYTTAARVSGVAPEVLKGALQAIASDSGSPETAGPSPGAQP